MQRTERETKLLKNIADDAPKFTASNVTSVRPDRLRPTNNPSVDLSTMSWAKSLPGRAS